MSLISYEDFAPYHFGSERMHAAQADENKRGEAPLPAALLQKPSLVALFQSR